MAIRNSLETLDDHLATLNEIDDVAQNLFRGYVAMQEGDETE
jgi:hypothetical protein